MTTTLPPETVPGPFVDRRRVGPAVSWPLPAAALGVLVLFVAVQGHAALAGAGVLAVATAVVALNAARTLRTDPVVLAIGALLAIVVGFPLAQLPHDRFVSYAFFSAAVAITLSAFRDRPHLAIPNPVPVAVLLLVLLVSSVLSPDAGAVKQLATIACVAVPMYLLPQLPGADRLPAVSSIIVALGAGESVLAILEPVLFPQHLWKELPVVGALTKPLQNTILPGVERSQGTLGHPLPMGLLLALGIVLLLRVLTGLPTPARVALVGLLLVGVVFSGDRNALLLTLGVLLWGRRADVTRIVVGLLLIGLGIVALAELGILTTAFFDQLVQSGSYTHRRGAYGSLDGLILTQSPAHIFFGNGFASTPRMFALGRLQNDGLAVVDNEFVLIQSQGGLVCLVALLSVVLAGVTSCRRELRPATVCVTMMMLIFDCLLWPSATGLVFLVLGLSFQLRFGAHGPALGRRRSDARTTVDTG